MPSRSLVIQLPKEIREELDRRLVANAFGGYEQLSEWLAEQGLEISKSSIQRYGTAFEKRLGALRLASQQAKAIAEAIGDDQNAMGEALVNLAQEKAFRVLMAMDLNPEDQDFAKLARSIADLNRAAVQQKKFAEEVRVKLEAKFKSLEEEGTAKGLDEATLLRVRQEIYGLF